MGRLNVAYPLRTRLLGHVDVEDHKIRRAIKVRITGPPDVDAISCLAQPLLQQSARKVVFLVYHDIQVFRSCIVYGICRGIMQPAPSALMSACLRFVSVEISSKQAATISRKNSRVGVRTLATKQSTGRPTAMRSTWRLPHTEGARCPTRIQGKGGIGASSSQMITGPNMCPRLRALQGHHRSSTAA